MLQALGVLARDMGQEAFLVGGMVRDLVIGHPNIDLDIVVVGDALRLGAEFARTTASAMKGRTRFGTCKVESRAFGTIDLATARSETYRSPGALPDVEASDLKADLARRDFSLNAMAISLSPARYGRLIDPFGGLADLSRGRLRVLHPASFRDDPTRMLRGVRFAGRFGATFERKTLALLRACLREGCMDSVSGKRIYTELRLICMEDEPSRSLALLGKYGVLESIDPVLGRDSIGGRHLKRLDRALRRFDEWVGEGFAETWLCWMAVLFLGLGRREAGRLAARLDLPGSVNEVCLWVSAGLPRTLVGLSGLGGGQAYRVVKLLRPVPPEGMVHLLAASERKQRRLIEAYVKKWRNVRPSLDGRDVLALGVREGPGVGRILERLLELRLQGKVKSRDDEIAYVGRSGGAGG